MERDEQRDLDVAQSIGGVILAGGKSSRMGGIDKALIPLDGQPLLSHVIARLAPQVSAIVISANGDLSRFRSFGLPVVPDSLGDHPGPLAGLLAGLEWYAEHRPGIRCAITVPTDTPFIPANLVDRLLAAKTYPPRPLIAKSMSGVHPVIGLWPIEVAHSLRASLEQGVRRVGAWTAQQSAIEVPFPQTEIGGKVVDPFFNINQPEDLVTAKTSLTKRAI
jgi:molybdopterin-guanine dinucleotide biosynthesis protein A